MTIYIIARGKISKDSIIVMLLVIIMFTMTWFLNPKVQPYLEEALGFSEVFSINSGIWGYFIFRNLFNIAYF